MCTERDFFWAILINDSGMMCLMNYENYFLSVKGNFKTWWKMSWVETNGFVICKVATFFYLYQEKIKTRREKEIRKKYLLSLRNENYLLCHSRHFFCLPFYLSLSDWMFQFFFSWCVERDGVILKQGRNLGLGDRFYLS